jgi:putative lipoic acid-binding regulatory protein
MSDGQSLQQFPCIYTFKVFGKRSDTFADRVRAIIGATLGTIAQDSVKVRESARGRFLSVTVVSRVDNEGQLARIYADLHLEHEVLFCL